MFWISNYHLENSRSSFFCILFKKYLPHPKHFNGQFFDGTDAYGPTVTTAQMPEQLIPKCIGTPGLIAFVLTAKFVDALPFYRQEKQFLRIGVKISRATMCSWAQKIAESCDILLMMLKKEILWIFRGGTLEHPGILFEYHPTRAGDVASVFLKGYKGVVQTDGYAGYGFIDGIKEILHMGCWAHVRRKFLDVVKAILRNSRWSRRQCRHL